jgi:hypothetical protein
MHPEVLLSLASGREFTAAANILAVTAFLYQIFRSRVVVLKFIRVLLISGPKKLAAIVRSDFDKTCELLANDEISMIAYCSSRISNMLVNSIISVFFLVKLTSSFTDARVEIVNRAVDKIAFNKAGDVDINFTALYLFNSAWALLFFYTFIDSIHFRRVMADVRVRRSQVSKLEKQSKSGDM